MVVGWHEDVARLGTKVTDYLTQKLGCQEFAEIEPADFFPLSGVSVERDVAQFPASKFYCSPSRNLVVFASNPPRSEWYRFLNAVLDVAERHCRVREIYTLGGMVTLGAHTAPRELVAVAGSPEMKAVLGRFGLAGDLDYQTPPGQRPTLNSFLMWAACRRSIPIASLWVPVPYYLLNAEDPQACRRLVETLDQMFAWGIDLGDLDKDVARHDETLAEARLRYPEIEAAIGKLETGVLLTQEESEALVEGLEEFLR